MVKVGMTVKDYFNETWDGNDLNDIKYNSCGHLKLTVYKNDPIVKIEVRDRIEYGIIQ